ncbi:MAG: SNF2-related protein, partial [Candidatus Cloacimonadota bacterium]|nr:SNF2-related protein [Candidatus Cloacimonadota bacterium]
MAKIFGREYHELSNSWHFRSSITEYEKDDIVLRFNKDEQDNNVLIFSPKEKNPFNKWKVTIVYDLKKRRIKDHKCSICGEDICEHYMTVLNFGYKNYSTSIFEKNTIQTFQTQLMSFNEFWQQVTLNAKIYLSDIYNNSDKIRLHFHEYRPINIRIASLIVSDVEIKDEKPADVMDVEKQSKAFSYEEIRLLQRMQQYRCAFSQNGYFFTIYKKDFIKILPILKNLSDKLFVYETGDPFIFSNKDFTLNFEVTKVDNTFYKMRAIDVEKISTSYGGHTTYIFEKNIIHTLQLPFLTEVTEALLSKGYEITKPDLVYINSVVARQLSFIHCHVEFEDGIEIADVYSNSPKITFNLYKKDWAIHLHGSLEYENDISIPMSVIRYPSELIRFDQDEKETWFYVPPQIKYQILKFSDTLPFTDMVSKDKDYHLIFEGEENIKKLKVAVYENSLPEWNIVLAENIKKEFIQKISLDPEIIARQSDKINWFEYQVTYGFQDMQFNHSELKKFFNSKEKFMELQDGRLVYFANKDAFDEIEDVLKQGNTEEKEDVYHTALHNVPYIYQLETVNKGIEIKGDQFIANMFDDILHRKMDNTTIPDSFNSIMRSYQKNGYHWLKMLSHYSLNGILADDMGLGKTIQAISVLTDLPKGSTSLVVSPKTLIFNWAAEI